MTREPNPRGSGEQLRAQLIEAASELLLSPQSVTLPSLRAVARACDVSPAAVYLHFGSQHALISAVIDAQLHELELTIRGDLQPRASVRDQLTQFGRSYVAWGLDHPGAYQLLFETADRLELPEHDLDSPNWDLIAEAATLVAAATGHDAEASRAGAFRLWAALHGIVSLRIHKPGVPWPDASAEVTAVVSRLTALD
jgi:AcrR family transcriptional regulator